MRKWEGRVEAGPIECCSSTKCAAIVRVRDDVRVGSRSSANGSRGNGKGLCSLQSGRSTRATSNDVRVLLEEARAMRVCLCLESSHTLALMSGN